MLTPAKKEFIEFMIDCNVLKFGDVYKNLLLYSIRNTQLLFTLDNSSTYDLYFSKLMNVPKYDDNSLLIIALDYYTFAKVTK